MIILVAANATPAFHSKDLHEYSTSRSKPLRLTNARLIKFTLLRGKCKSYPCTQTRQSRVGLKVTKI